MLLSHFFAVFSGISFLSGGLMRYVSDENEYLVYGWIGMIISLIACGFSGHAGI